MRTALLLVLLALPLAAASGAHAVSGGGATLSMDDDEQAWPAVPYLQDLCFTWRNAGRSWLVLPNAAPWAIVDAQGEVVYAPVAADSLVAVAPGMSRQGCWDHQDARTHAPVLPGEHAVEWVHAEVEGGEWAWHVLRLPFTLSPAAP